MGSQWSRDAAYIRAKKSGFRSRAAFKLIEIQEKFGIVRPEDTIIDLGAAPGSWLQVLRGLTTETVIGVDLNPIAPIEGVITITGDFTQKSVLDAVEHACGGQVNVVVCDAAPKLSGQRSYDQARIMALAEESLEFASSVLKPGGNFVVKAFQGEYFDAFFADLKARFRSVRAFHAKSSRKGSRETYIIAKNYTGEKNAAC